MVTPIAVVRPGICGIGPLPIEPLLRDSVGVVAICRRRINKTQDHRGQQVRIRKAEGFPILKDVAPVALESDPPLALGSSRPDVEEVPRPRRITMPPAERQGQILGCEAAQIGVPRRGTCRHKAVHIGFLWQ